MAGIVGLTELQHTNGNSMLTVATTGDGNVKSEGGATTTSLQQGLTKAWAHVAAGGLSLPDSFNCSSIDDDGTGEYGINFSNNMGSANYSAIGQVTFNADGSNQLRNFFPESKATTSVEMDSSYINAASNTQAYDIEVNGSLAIHGDLA